MRRNMMIGLNLLLVLAGFSAVGTGEECKDETVPASAGAEIHMTELESGKWIRGTVSGLPSGEEGKFKVLVYVLTDKWYIHPEAVATPGRGFADIDATGHWEIGSVWRGHQATRLALLVVARPTWAPPTIEPGEMQPEESLRSRLTPLALSVQEAPAGI